MFSLFLHKQLVQSTLSKYCQCYRSLDRAFFGMEVSGHGHDEISFSDRILMIEQQELEAPQGRLTPEIYCEFLALYILHGDLNNSKFLWKRIPAEIKTESAEIRAVWEVGKAFWKKDFAGVFQKCNSFTWSEIIQKIIDEIKSRHKNKCLGLVRKAYSTISVETAAALLGCSKQECLDIANENGWKTSGDQTTLIPSRQEKFNGDPMDSETHLQKLTEYISFLET